MLNPTLGECKCSCHNPPEGAHIAHCMACCRQCHYCQKNIVTHHVDEHKKQCAPIHALDVELGFFDKNRKKWFKHHAGKFALIKGTTVHDFYDTSNNAYEVGLDLWGLVPFLIKEVQLVDKIEYLPTNFEVKVRDEDQDEHSFVEEPT